MPDDPDYWNRQATRTMSGERGNIRYGTDRPAWGLRGDRPTTRTGLGNWQAGLRQQYRDFSNIMGIKRSYARGNNRNGSR